MRRWSWFLICFISGLGMIAGGLLVPAHLRAVDACVLATAGKNSPTVTDRGLALAREGNAGAARLMLRAADAERLPGREKLSELLTGPTKPGMARPAAAEPFTDWVIRLTNREPVLAYLRSSPLPAVQELLGFREVTNTVLFPPSTSASGQALDAALSLCGLMLADGALTTGLSNSVAELARQANRGANTQPFEQVLMSLLSLGERFNRGQMEVFVRQVQDPETLRRLSELTRKADGQLPDLFAAVALSGRPDGVAKYLMDFSQTGFTDLAASLRYGAGGVDELLRRDQRLYRSGFSPPLLLPLSVSRPWLAVGLKWLLYLAGGFLLAMALHFARPSVPALERPLQVRGFHIAREILFALGFLLVLLLLSEPFLARESQRVEFPFRLRLPMTGGAVPIGTAGLHASIMNPHSLLTLLLFFVLQGLLYVACLFKLAEIRRQQVPPRMKLRLLENEDHLFDAGLYLGFVGTIISLILVSLGLTHFSLMAAYSSTSFGIIFVSVFKICHLRPARRRLLLEAEAASPDEPPGVAVSKLAITS